MPAELGCRQEEANDDLRRGNGVRHADPSSRSGGASFKQMKLVIFLKSRESLFTGNSREAF